MNLLNIAKIFEIFSSTIDPKTELNYSNEFELLIAVVLSAQSTDKMVNKVTQQLFMNYKTPQDFLSLSLQELQDKIKQIGLYKTKAKNILILCNSLVFEYNSKVPNTFEELIKLAGVGRKTANVILNELFDKPTIAVDTHVFRVSRRIGLSNSTSILKVEDDLLKLVPDKYKKNAHHYLVLHGRYVCKALKPLCNNCNINQYCTFYTNNNLN
mgnify:CR=1 FL=1